MLRPQMGLLLEATEKTPESSGLGAELLGLMQVLVALALVSALAFAVLRLLARRGLGRHANAPSLRIEARLPLDPSSALVVVAFEGRRLLLSTHRQAPARLIAELSAAQPETRSTSRPDGAPPLPGIDP